MSEEFKLGWIPDLPDYRDYTIDHEAIKPCLIPCKVFGDADGKALPNKVDPRPNLTPPIMNQLNLGACTCNAAAYMYAMYLKIAGQSYENLSRLFLYKVTRNLLGFKGDTGAYLRSAMQALAMFGAPPERYYPYVVKDFEKEPSAFAYAMAQNYQAITYYRLDKPAITPEKLLDSIRVNLSSSRPVIFGFTVYRDAFEAGLKTGRINMPKAGDKVIGGHAMTAVGFDDITQYALCANSHGTTVGENGFVWLHYDYILKSLAQDWWVMTKAEWLDLACFK